MRQKVASFTILGYLDPGSGSMLLQLLVGGMAGVGVAFKFYGRSFWNRFQGNQRLALNSVQDDGQPEPAEASPSPN